MTERPLNYRQRNLVAFVQRNPGCTVADVSAQFGFATHAETRRILHRLCVRGDICRIMAHDGVRSYLQYFATEQS